MTFKLLLKVIVNTSYHKTLKNRKIPIISLGVLIIKIKTW